MSARDDSLKADRRSATTLSPAERGLDLSTLGFTSCLIAFWRRTRTSHDLWEIIWWDLSRNARAYRYHCNEAIAERRGWLARGARDGSGDNG